MVVLNDLDRFHLVMDVIERVPNLKGAGAHVLQEMLDRLVAHKQYIMEHGDDMPEIRSWKWSRKV
jgi:xylulose-5-phosphate/fructose-6-phosphate phosphoketolase